MSKILKFFATWFLWILVCYVMVSIASGTFNIAEWSGVARVAVVIIGALMGGEFASRAVDE